LHCRSRKLNRINKAKQRLVNYDLKIQAGIAQRRAPLAVKFTFTPDSQALAMGSAHTGEAASISIWHFRK
jgi:hypothetical protein